MTNTPDRPGHPGQRRALSHVATPIERTELSGPHATAKLLGQIFSATAREDVSDTGEDESARAHVHGFHSYPARMHPSIAAEAIEHLAPAHGVVLDPFCGGGTVLVEGSIAGRAVMGVDVNPLAVRLAELRAGGRSAAHLDALIEAARRAALVAETRRKAKAGASKRYPDVDVALFAPHVLLELDGLRLGIDATPDDAVRRDLELVLSSILTKVSQKSGDSSERTEPKRIAAGYPSRLLVRKTEELAQRIEDFSARVPRGTPAPDVFEDDARALRDIEDQSVDLIVTSPPYPGNYDYLSHHEDRLRWLRLDAKGFDENELGARRHLEADDVVDPVATWQNDVRAFLAAMRRVLTPDGCALLVIADSVVAEQAMFSEDIVARVAPLAGMQLVARASQLRPHFHGPTQRLFRNRPRREHALLLEPSSAAAPIPSPSRAATPRSSPSSPSSPSSLSSPARRRS